MYPKDTDETEVSRQTPAQRRPANLVPIARPARDGEPDLPAHIRQRAYQEVSGDAEVEWDPVGAYEELEGTLVRKTSMSLGGTAYLLAIGSEEANQNGAKPTLVLLKKGGKVLDAALAAVEIGARVWIRFCGLREAKPGLHPARDWRVIRPL